MGLSQRDKPRINDSVYSEPLAFSASQAPSAVRTGDLYYNNKAVYPVGPPPAGQVDTAAPPNASTVNITELLTSNLLHQAPPATETFTYIVNANYGNGTVHGVLAGAACLYNP